MKKIVRVNESELVRMIKHIIRESLSFDNYTINAVNGKFKITNKDTKTSYFYYLKAKIPLVGYRQVDVESIDDTKMEVSYGLASEEVDIDLEALKTLISDNFGKSTIQYKRKDGNTVYFYKTKE